jgi:hypothetical protein
MDIPKILSARPTDDKKLIVKFSNGMEKIYDCKPLIERYEAFKPLKNEVFFQQVKVDAGGYGISWDDRVDLSEYELWTNAIEVVTA